MNNRPARNHPNRLGLLRRAMQQMRTMLQGSKFEPHSEFPEARIMTNRMLRKQPWAVPLQEPDWRNPADDGHMRPEDPVLGIYRNGKAWALPWWIMIDHHIANLVLDGQPVLVTLCGVCSSGSAFESMHNAQRLSFQMAGLYNGTHLIKDVETGSLWNHINGEALFGPLKGTFLERIALVQCEWREWLSMHPDSLVLWGEQKLRTGFGSQHSPGSPAIGAELRKSLARPIDQRIEHNTLVLGVEGDGTGFAFPLPELDKIGPVLHTAMDKEEIVIFHLPGSVHALAYSPVLDGEKLEFFHEEQSRIVDRQTGSHWNYAGECYAGAHRGSKLRYVSSGVAEWYVWAAHHPNTGLFSSNAIRRATEPPVS
jgi:Protein of unknown function (DUF3179)